MSDALRQGGADEAPAPRPAAKSGRR
jgi:hypothetical protein